jgi:DNA-binding LacI/PurR family transcriptional regulator
MSPNERVTIRDVAREAGVGVGTVSRVLGGSDRVSRETRARVLRVIEQLGFRPSRAARALVRGKTETLGVLVPFFTKDFFVEVLRGIESAASAADYSLIVYNVERPEQALTYLDFLWRTLRIDALLIVSLSPSLVLQAYPREYPFPIAAVDTALPRALSLQVNNIRGMQLAVGHLTENGHRQIALVDRYQDPVSRTREPGRRQGYERACMAADITPPPDYYVLADFSDEGGYQATNQLLALSQPPSAIACASDRQAIGAMRAAHEHGLRVGFDIAITGYHDIEPARWVGLTTVRVPAGKMGETAVRGLLEQLGGQQTEPATITFEPELVVRETSGGKRRHWPLALDHTL